MTRIIKVKTGSKFEEMGSYSRLVALDNWIYVSNTAGRNPVTQEIPADVSQQTLQVFANIEAALAAIDTSLKDVVFSRVFIQDPNDVPIVMAIIGDKFRGINPATTVTCPPLGSTVYKVELEKNLLRYARGSKIANV